MSDPTFDASLLELGQILKRLNEETEAINEQIRSCERTLVEMNPGFSLSSEPLYVRANESAEAGPGVDFLFGKIQDAWGLWLRRGKFQKSDNGWKYVHGSDSKVLPLIDGTREERAAAVAKFPALIEDMKRIAQERLTSLEAAKKRGIR